MRTAQLQPGSDWETLPDPGGAMMSKPHRESYVARPWEGRVRSGNRHDVELWTRSLGFCLFYFYSNFGVLIIIEIFAVLILSIKHSFVWQLFHVRAHGQFCHFKACTLKSLILMGSGGAITGSCGYEGIAKCHSKNEQVPLGERTTSHV